MQLRSCSRRSEVGGDLAEEKRLLSLAWSEVGCGLVMEDERLMAALVECFGRWSRCGRKKKSVYRGERKVHVAFGGQLVAYCGGAGGGSGWRLERRWREKEDRGLCRKKNWGGGWFFLIF